MKILTINSGSTSIKFKLYSMPEEKVLAHGKVENIGQEDPKLTFYSNGYSEERKSYDIPDHRIGLKLLIDKLKSSRVKVIKNKKDINAIGHRVVHIRDKASEPLKINNKVIKNIEDCIELAPLHNPPNLIGIKTCLKLFRGIPNIGVFDNTFHKDLPEKAFMYSIPVKYYKKYKIRRYGFHGIAYTYMVKRVAAMLNKDLSSLKIIALMLGGGSSAAACKFGKSIDTSMGFTPVEGLFSSTRSGDLDPSVPIYLMKKEYLSIKKVDYILNNRSGMFGLSEKYKDFREIEEGVMLKDEKCLRAFETYAYRIKKYIGAYTAAMNGVDVVVFGGGIGENSYLVRKAILEDLNYLGVNIDENKNRNLLKEGFISSSDSKVKVCVVNVDEGLVIARQTYEVSNSKN